MIISLIFQTPSIASTRTASIILWACTLLLSSTSSFSVPIDQSEADTLVATIKTSHRPPVVVLLDTCPSPHIVQINAGLKPIRVIVPEKPGAYYIQQGPEGSKKVQLLPPTTHKLPVGFAQGKSFFTTFDSDDGLAMDGVSWGHKSALCDRSGNLWFGTQGGGVSRYDGKSFTIFTTGHGLANNTVWSILEDQSGNIWFGTYGGGVSRYDGKSFTSFTTEHGLTNNNVRSIIEDQNGDLWFGTEGGGVSRYDGKRAGHPCNRNICKHDLRVPQDLEDHNMELAKSFTTFSTEQGLADNTILCILEDQSGNIWFGTDGSGVSRYDKEASLVRCNSNSCDHDLKNHEDLKNHNKSLAKAFTTYTTDEGLAGNTIWSIEEDQRGDLWFGTNGSGVSHYDWKSFTTYTTEQGLASNKIRCITEDQSGILWFGTEGGGVSRYDGKSFTTYGTDEGLVNNIVWSITEDKSGIIWFGTYGGGLSRYDGKSFTTFTTEQGLANNNIRSILEDQNGDLWFGSGGGVSRYDWKSFTSFSINQGLAHNNVRSILEDQWGNLWFGTEEGGVSLYDGKSFTTFTTEHGLASNNIRCIVEDQNGNLWFGTNGSGVSRYDGKSFTTYTTEHGLANNTVWSIIEDQSGFIWFGTYGSGVSRYDGKSFTTFTTEQGLGDNTVLSITEDRYGNLWFGTYGGGLSRYDGHSFITFTTEHGLPDNVVLGVVTNIQAGLVIGTNFGLAIINTFEPILEGPLIPAQNNLSTEKLKNYNPVFKVYNQFTGYPVRDVNGGSNNGALLCDSRGVIWVGTGSSKTALVRFKYSAVHTNKEAPTVVIQNVKVHEENICWYTLSTGIQNFADVGLFNTNIDSTLLVQQEVMTYSKVLSQKAREAVLHKFAGILFDGISRFYPLPENLVLPHEHNHLSFEYNTVVTVRHFLVNYQYMLEGQDEKWSPVTKKTDVTYGNLYEGEYTFLLKAQSPDGVWSEPLKYRFEVLPPWYRTWWAYFGYSIAGVFVVGLIVWLNGRRLRFKAKELAEEVQIATREVRNQKKKIEEAHKDITDSVRYAQRIQSAILPPIEEIKESLPEMFVLFKPKDIVSGDFYFYAKVDSTLVLAACDCTGHGVPGAFMSMIGSRLLSEIVINEKVTDAAEILNSLKRGVIKALGKAGAEGEQKDGMDMCLCVFQKGKHGTYSRIQYAGAYNPLFIVRRNSANGLQNKEVEEIKADLRPVGYLEGEEKSFTNHEIELNIGDSIYLMSDGYQDQFGGKRGKKFMVKRLRKLLVSMSDRSMEEQHDIMNETIEDWKGQTNQIDDILAIGVRVE